MVRLTRAQQRLIIAIVAVLAIIVAWFLWPDNWWPRDECGAGSRIWRTAEPHQECIGVTDGGDFFNDPGQVNSSAERQVIERINAVQEKILAENKAVADEPRYVKAVLLMPLTVSAEKASAIPLDQIQRGLEGIYTAQRRANQSTIFGDPGAVRLQVLLANQGSRQEVGDDFVKQVLGVSEPDHPLVGVVGLGSSTTDTERLARRLGAEGIPMVGAITSADSLTGLPRFWSVSPSNIHYVRALRAFLRGQGSLTSGRVVFDANNDPYPRTLKAAFESLLGPYIKFPALSYIGGTEDVPATSNIFGPVVTNLCVSVNSRNAPLDMVFYAGRVADFEAFAEALENRTCQARPLAVLVGATGFEAARRYAGTLENGNVTVIYATSSDFTKWTQNAPGTPPDFGSFIDAYRSNGFDPADLADGLAIAHHDAFATLASATRLATPGPDMPNPASVASQFNQLQSAYLVRGASGRLAFPDSARGRAVNRGIPLRQIGMSTPIRLPEDLTPYEVTGP